MVLGGPSFTQTILSGAWMLLNPTNLRYWSGSNSLNSTACNLVTKRMHCFCNYNSISLLTLTPFDDLHLFPREPVCHTHSFS